MHERKKKKKKAAKKHENHVSMCLLRSFLSPKPSNPAAPGLAISLSKLSIANSMDGLLANRELLLRTITAAAYRK
jgi:hypothetical protein